MFRINKGLTFVFCLYLNSIWMAEYQIPKAFFDSQIELRRKKGKARIREWH